MNFDNPAVQGKLFYIMGKPKCGKTKFVGTFPKPCLVISVGGDGGASVIAHVDGVKFKILHNDVSNIANTSYNQLAQIIAWLSTDEAKKLNFATVAIDTVGAVQDDYRTYLEFVKKSKLSQQEWGDVQTKMMSHKDRFKAWVRQNNKTGVWLDHVRIVETPSSDGLEKQLTIAPTLTVSSADKFLKDCDYILYLCRQADMKTKKVRFLTWIGASPIMQTGIRMDTAAISSYINTDQGYIVTTDYDNMMKVIEELKATGQIPAWAKVETVTLVDTEKENKEKESE